MVISNRCPYKVPYWSRDSSEKCHFHNLRDGQVQSQTPGLHLGSLQRTEVLRESMEMVLLIMQTCPCSRITAASEHLSEGHPFLLPDALSLLFLAYLKKKEPNYLVWPKFICQHLHWVQNEAYCDLISLSASETFIMTSFRSSKIDLRCFQTIFLSNLTFLESSKNADFLWDSISNLSAH